MPLRTLPDQASLENLRKQAKTLAKEVRAADPAALARVREFHPQAAQISEPVGLRLADAQLVLAREYGFASWHDLVVHVSLPGAQSRRLHALDRIFRGLRGTRSKALTLAELLVREVEAIRDAHRKRLPAAAELLRLHGSNGTGRLSDEEIFAQDLTSDQARALIARFHRFVAWSEVIAEGDRPVDLSFEAAADAIVSGDAEALRGLIERSPSLVHARSPFKHRATLLHYVAANGVEEIRQWQSPANAAQIARMLLDAGADPDATCSCYAPDDTPLTLVVTSGHPAGAGVQADLVETLCRAGANPNGRDDDGMPLWAAIKFEYASAAERLARCGARLDNLLFAAAVGDMAAVRASFDESGRLRSGQGWGRARAAARELSLDHFLEHALIFAAAHGRRDVVSFLLTKHPDLSIKEPFWGATALGAARFFKHHDIVALLEPLGTTHPVPNLEAPQSILHVCNGHGTMKPLRDAKVPGRFALSCDPLLFGPCPALWGAAWRGVRGPFLAASRPEGGGGPTRDEDLSDEDLDRALSGDETDEVVLWYEHDLYDQLLLIRALALAQRHTGPRVRLSLVSLGEHPEIPTFKGLGQLRPEQLADLFGVRVVVSKEMITLGGDAWGAYTSLDPRHLEELIAHDLSPLPFLARAIRRHLEEFPGFDDGLSRTERHLLSLLAGGAVDARQAWNRLDEGEDCHYVADSWFAAMVARLAAAPAPLVQIEGDLRLPLVAGRATLLLTPLGHEVQRGQIDWLARLGRIDRWLGGVHLTGPREAWRWDRSAAMLRRCR